MNYLKRFNEDLEPDLVNALNYLKFNKPKKVEIEDSEDLNISKMEKDTIFKTISKYWYLPYDRIAKILGIDRKNLKRKLEEYDLVNLKSQLKSRNGVGWTHPYNQIKIEKYNSFINELYKVKNYDTSTKNTKYVDVILDEPTDQSSLSHSILLKKKFRDLENQEVLQTLSNVKKMTPSQRSLFFKGLQKKSPNLTKLSITINNLQFLKHKKNELGELYCEYCKKGPLKVYDFNPNNFNLEQIKKDKGKVYRLMNNFNKSDGATCDHKNPISKGGDLFNYNNLAVCCYSCNKQKDNMSWEDWVKKINLKE